MKKVDSKSKNNFSRNVLAAFFIFLILLSSTNFVFSSEDDLPLVISEIMYDPAGADGDHEWFELTNNSNNKIEIDSIKKYRDRYVLNVRVCTKKESDVCEGSFPVYSEEEGIDVEEDEILIITNDVVNFEKSYPDFNGKILEANFSLGNGREGFVRIYQDNDNKINWIDEVEYSSDWGGDDNGKSLEKIKLEEGDLESNWAESLLAGGTPGKKYSNEKPIFSDDLKINEIFPDPEGPDGDGEFVEIFNDSNKDVELDGWSIQDESEKSFYFDKNHGIKGGDFLAVFYDESRISLNNGGDEIKLLNPIGEEIHGVKYGDSLEGHSFSLNDDDKFKWTDIATPGKQNEFQVEKVYPQKIKFNEIFSNPEGADNDEEWVEFFNDNDFEVDLTKWKIKNSSDKIFEIKSGKIDAGKLSVIPIKETSFAIKNSKEKLFLLDPNNKEVDGVEMIESAPSGSSFNVSEDGTWSWSRHPTPGMKNKINHRPKIKIDIPDDFYEGMKMEFDASKTTDEDKDELKFRWEFGDNHASYLRKTSHVYKETGEYQVILRVSDGSGYVYKNFGIEVEKYPKREVKIVKLIPNPIGKDSENEIIWLKNETDKKINLKGWSVATGGSSKKLTNHPIYNDFVINSGDTEELKRDDCKFSLLNKKGQVVLRYPNGETADKVKYEKDKIEEGEFLEIENDELIWTGGKSIEKSSVGEEERTDFEEDIIEVQGISFQEQLLKAVLNDKMGCCETFQKILIDNWKYKNKWQAKFANSFLSQT